MLIVSWLLHVLKAVTITFVIDAFEKRKKKKTRITQEY